MSGLCEKLRYLRKQLETSLFLGSEEIVKRLIIRRIEHFNEYYLYMRYLNVLGYLVSVTTYFLSISG